MTQPIHWKIKHFDTFVCSTFQIQTIKFIGASVCSLKTVVITRKYAHQNYKSNTVHSNIFIIQFSQNLQTEISLIKKNLFFLIVKNQKSRPTTTNWKSQYKWHRERHPAQLQKLAWNCWIGRETIWIHIRAMWYRCPWKRHQRARHWMRTMLRCRRWHQWNSQLPWTPQRWAGMNLRPKAMDRKVSELETD